ncbi:hypothetical protein [Streptomyces sp. NPDC059278]|uniref:hypothetical protein n=1 Tax=Streptomyces sp. NPDC059278 TaxID=3346801 RepID=UPI00367C908C
MEPDVVRRALDALGRKIDGESAAAKTALRKRSAFSEVLGTAVDKGYFAENPLARVKWQAPGVSEEVDPACVPNPTQVARLLTAVGRLQGRGPHLEAFFGCMYYAAMRPAEVIHLQISQCHLPKSGWGMLNLSGGVVTAGKEWTDDGAVHEVHSLKRRAVKATRMARNCWSGLGYRWDELEEGGISTPLPWEGSGAPRGRPTRGKPQVRRLLSCP